MAEASDACWDAAAVKAAAGRAGKTAAQVLLRWGLQHHGTVVPKSTKVGRLEENLAVFDFELSAEEMTAISAMDKNRRFNDPAMFTPFMNSYCPIHQ